MVARYIVDFTNGMFQDEYRGLIIDFCDREGSVNDRGELLSRFLVALPVCEELDLVTRVDFIIVSANKFVEFALITCWRTLEFVLSVCDRFQEPLFPLVLEFYRAGEACLREIGGNQTRSP